MSSHLHNATRRSRPSNAHPPVAMLLVLTCLLNPSHHPACSAKEDCGPEIELYSKGKEKAEKDLEECKWSLQQVRAKETDLELQNKDLRSNQEKLMTELRQCKEANEINGRSNSAMWTNVLGVGAVFFFLSVAFNILQFFINQQTHGKETAAEKRAAAFEAELNSVKSNPFHHHAQLSYMKQFEKFSETQLGIDLKLKVLDAPLGITDGGGGGGGVVAGEGGGGSNGGDRRSEAVERNCGSDANQRDDMSRNGPPSIAPVQDSEAQGLRCRRH